MTDTVSQEGGLSVIHCRYVLVWSATELHTRLCASIAEVKTDYLYLALRLLASFRVAGLLAIATIPLVAAAGVVQMAMLTGGYGDNDVSHSASAGPQRFWITTRERTNYC